MKTTRLFSVLMAMCLSLGVYAVDWSTIGWVEASDNKYKVEAVDGLGVVNVQQPGFAAEKGIYVTAPAGISEINVASAIQGAGAVLYLSAFTAQETPVTIKHGTGELTFLVYYADGTAGGGGAGVEYDVNFALASKGATATASSGNPAEALDDNVGGTRWESAQTDDQWFLLDLGQVRTFNTVQIVWEGAYGSSFTIDYSVDSTTWTNFATVTDQTLAGFPYEQLLEVPEAVTAQYVRFTGTKRGTGYGYSFWEFRVLNASTSILTSLSAKAASDLVKLGEQVAITVTAKDQNGKTMDGVSIEYTVSPADAGVVENGQYKPTKAGSATITAKSGEIAATPISVFAYEGENVALSTSIDNSKVIAQSEAPTDAFHAVDGNEGSVWQGCPTTTTADDEASRTYDSWFVLDLGAYYDVTLVTINFEGACSQEYHLDFSADNNNWNLAYDYKGNAGVNGHTDMLYGDNLKNNTSVRFVRFYSTKAATQYGMKIFELKVFATPGSAPADDEKPVMVSASLVSNTFNSAVIAVDATDNVAVAKYNVKDEANAFSGSFAAVDGNITVTGLTPETTYNLVITALDLVGNESEVSKTVQVVTPVHLTEPNVAAAAPTVAAAWVKAVYSDAYGATHLGFGEWGGGYAMANKAIGTDNYKMLSTANGTYFGLIFEGQYSVNATGMKYLHFDIWAENDGTVGIYPIYWVAAANTQGKECNGGECFVTQTLKGQQWNSITITLAEDFANVSDWSSVYQIKLADTGGNNLAVDNIYFYTDPIVDEEKPTNVTATLASASYTSIVLTCQAEDNNGVVSFDVYNGETKVGTGGGESGKPVTVAVNNLEAGKEYTLAVEAYDQNNNKADRVEVKATTVAFPAPATAPTVAETNVYAIYSDAYTTLHAPLEYNQSWWMNPTMQSIKLGEDNALLYTSSGDEGGCFGWTWTPVGAAEVTTDLTGYITLHYDIYPEASGTVRFGITRRPDGTADVHNVFEVVGGQWNHIALDLTEQDLSQVYQLGFWHFSTVKSFILDNVYFEKPEPAGMKGTYTVGGEGADFASLAEACAAVNAKPIEGDVTLAIAADLTEAKNIGLINTTEHTITIRPDGETLRTITFTQSGSNKLTGSLVIGAADPVGSDATTATKNVVIDGCAEGSTVSALAIVHDNLGGSFRIVAGSSNNAIKNLHISYGKNSSGTRYPVWSQGGDITIAGNTIIGNGANRVIQLETTGNTLIEGNTLEFAELAAASPAYGIHGYSVTGNVTIRNNKFTKVTTTLAADQGIAAVSCQGGTWLIENNYFAGMDFLNITAGTKARMDYIRVAVINTVTIRHNTFYIPSFTNKPANEDTKVAAVESASLNGVVLSNNLFVSAEETAQHTFLKGAKFAATGNVFYHAENAKAFIENTNAWEAYSAADATAVWSEVAFTDAAKGDLSLAAANEKLLVPAIADVTTDINGTARGAEKTYAGAFEFVAPAGPTEMWLAPNWGEITAGGDMFEVAVNFDIEVSEEQLAEGLTITKDREDIMVMGVNPFMIYVPADASAGQLNITVKYGELEAFGNYTILSAGPQGISITPFQDLEIESLGTLQLEAMLYPEDAEAAVVWFSSDETLATVSTTGLVTSLVTAKDTVVRITAAAEGFEGIEAYVDITLLAAKAAAGVTFELNGGTQEVPADNEALWAEFMEDYNSYLNAGRSPQDLDNCASNPVAVFITSASWNVDFMIKDDSPQQWLGSYIIAHTANTANPITAESAHTAWRGELQGFFLAIDNADNTACGYWGGYGKYNWTEAGQPSAWQPAYQFGNAPVKDGYKFTGWYTDAACTTLATALPESGALYAGWSNETTALENTAVENSNVRKVFENGNVYILRDGVRYTITGIVVE